MIIEAKSNYNLLKYCKCGMKIDYFFKILKNFCLIKIQIWNHDVKVFYIFNKAKANLMKNIRKVIFSIITFNF